jgi:hypothetical protein
MGKGLASIFASRLSWFFTAPVYVLYVTNLAQSKVVGALRAPTNKVIQKTAVLDQFLYHLSKLFYKVIQKTAVLDQFLYHLSKLFYKVIQKTAVLDRFLYHLSKLFYKVIQKTTVLDQFLYHLSKLFHKVNSCFRSVFVSLVQTFLFLTVLSVLF